MRKSLATEPYDGAGEMSAIQPVGAVNAKPADVDIRQIADIRITRAMAIVERQRQLVAQLAGRGDIGETAISILQTMESVLANMLRNRDLAARAPLQVFTRNRILWQLPKTDFTQLAKKLKPVSMPVSEIVVGPNACIRHVTFMESGVVAVMARSQDQFVEIGSIGRDGVTGAPAILGISQSPLKYLTVAAGDGLRLSVEDLQDAMLRSDSLRKLLYRYFHTFQIQTAQAAAFFSVANILERVAGWLLSRTHPTGEISLETTHEALAEIFAVRRASITDALHRWKAKAPSARSAAESSFLTAISCSG